MNKAFIKEDSDSDNDSELSDHVSPSGSKNYITPKGARTLKSELRHLLKKVRPKVVETISWAAGNGDRSENGDYIYGKKRLREIDRRIRFLNKRLDSVEVVNPAKIKSNQILFGATITVEDEEGKKMTYQIVGIDETNVKSGKISWISPIGKSLLNNRRGDVVTVNTPKGQFDLEILEITYQ